MIYLVLYTQYTYIRNLQCSFMLTEVHFAFDHFIH